MSTKTTASLRQELGETALHWAIPTFVLNIVLDHGGLLEALWITAIVTVVGGGVEVLVGRR